MRIKFKRFGSNTAVGSFQPGDVLTCGDAMARHLVEEAKVAEFMEPKAEPVSAQPIPPKRRRKE